MTDSPGPRSPLAGQRVVVLGGSSGIGLATARAAAAAGAAVVIAARSQEKLERAQQQVGSGAETYAVDVRDAAALGRLFGTVGRLNHLVVSTGAAVFGPFLELSPQKAREHFDVKFWGAYQAARAAVPHLDAGGSITFISGLAAAKAVPHFAATGAADAAVEALSRTLALELAPLRVNAVSPGTIDTPAHAHLSQQQRSDMFRRVADALPVRRVGTADDVAGACLYLMTSHFVTGATLHVDGGDRLVGGA